MGDLARHTAEGTRHGRARRCVVPSTVSRRRRQSAEPAAGSRQQPAPCYDPAGTPGDIEPITASAWATQMLATTTLTSQTPT